MIEFFYGPPRPTLREMARFCWLPINEDDVIQAHRLLVGAFVWADVGL